MKKEELSDPWEACREVARKEGKNFAWGFRFLPPEKRDAMCALYAFARRTDDIVDEGVMPSDGRRRIIDAWEEAVGAEVLGGPGNKVGRSPQLDFPDAAAILSAMAAVTRRFQVPGEELLLLIEGCREDITVRRYASFQDTLEYCRKVAVTVGMAMLAIFECRTESARRAMASLGYAFQLTNIIRDIPEDALRDRIYLPQDEMRRFRVLEDDLNFGRGEGLRPLLREISRKAEKYYDGAEPLLQELDPGAAKTMKVMMRIYRGILEVMKKSDFEVWQRRPRLSAARKASIVAATALGL